MYRCGVKTEHLRRIGNLTSLSRLDLRSNQITDATPIKDLIQKQREVGGLVLEVSSSTSWEIGKATLGDNPLKTPPMEVVAQGTEAFLRWFEENGKNQNFKESAKVKDDISAKDESSVDKTEIAGDKTKNNDVISEQKPEDEVEKNKTSPKRYITNGTPHLKNVKEDALGAKSLAKTIAPLLDNMAYDLETMFGVFGHWGRGKTFFVNELIKILENKKDPKIKLKH